MNWIRAVYSKCESVNEGLRKINHLLQINALITSFSNICGIVRGTDLSASIRTRQNDHTTSCRRRSANRIVRIDVLGGRDHINAHSAFHNRVVRNKGINHKLL